MRGALAVIGIVLLVVLSFWFVSRKPEPTPDTPPTTTMNGTFTLSSPAFAEGASIPSQYTCDGDNVSPPLVISGVPKDTGSLVLIMDDPDVPKSLKPDGVFDHWVMYGIPPDMRDIPEGALSGAAGLNGAGQPKYTGPCPPPQYEPREHRYFFKLYAVKGTLNFIKAPTKDEVLTAIKENFIAETGLMGRYKRIR